MDKTEKKQSVIKSALAMSVGTFSSRILGMFRDIVLFSLFPRTVTDAFVVAFRLPNMFRRLLGEGSLSVSFIPVYIDQLTKKPGETDADVKLRAENLSSGIFTLLLATVLSLTALGLVFMEPIIDFLVSGGGYQAIAGKTELTVRLARIMFVYLFLVTSYAFFMALLNAHKKFFLPAIGPTCFNAIFILFALLPQEQAAFSGQFLAWGVLVGGFAQVLVVLIPLYKLGHLPKFKWRYKSPGVRRVLMNTLPGMLGFGILQIMGLININFASRLEEGAHSYIYLADRILELPQSLIAISLGAALLPTLSELWSQNKRQQMISEGQRYMRLLLFLAMPAAVGMWVLAEPIVSAIYFRKMFSVQDVQQTAMVVQVYSILLIASSLNKVTVPSFYAVKNTWLPAAVSAFCLLVHIVVANHWVDIFGLQGLVASTAMAGLINVVLVLFFYNRMLGKLELKTLLLNIGKMMPGLVAMAFMAKYSHQLLWQVAQGLPLELARALVLLVVVMSSAALYFLICSWCQVTEAKQVLVKLKSRFKM